MKLKRFAAVAAMTFVALGFGLTDAFAADDAAAESAAAEPAKPKPPKKKLEYANWDEAVEVATAWDQPIIAFVELQGDKVSAKLKGATFGKQELVKDFLYKNAIFYHIAVPAKKPPKNARGNVQKKDKDARPTPDLTLLKESERRPVARLVGEPPYLPCIAVATPAGRVLTDGGISLDEESKTPLTSLMNQMKSAFESGKFTLTESAKVAKLIAKEEKTAAAEAKRNKGKKSND